MADKPRIRAGIKYGHLYTLIIMLVGTAAVELLAEPLAHVFGLNGETEVLCISAMHIISISFVFAGFNVAMQGVFQALEGGLESLVISVCRQIVFVLPVAWLFAKLVRQTQVSYSVIWLTFPIAEVVTAVVAAALMIRIGRKLCIFLK